MRLTHFGHATVLIEAESGHRALIDPGCYSTGFESLTGLDMVLVTHEHPDHIDAGRFAALRGSNPEMILVGNASATAAAGTAHPDDRVIADHAPVEIAGFRITPTGAFHAPIYPTFPAMANTGFILDDRVWHPGDSFDAEPREIDVLLLPVGGPWMKIAEAIDFARAVEPRVVIPIHQAGLADVHRSLHYGLLRNLLKAEVVVLEEGEPADV